MCGIAGLFDAALGVEEAVECLEQMLGTIRHRGPDEMGYYFDDAVAMGTARLSIIDVKDGQQPIGDTAGRYWMCFNGEIYNFKELRAELAAVGRKFSTESDTEVLLHAWIVWGPDALARLNGPFAFALYDRLRRSIVLARDRYGKRPLFYVNGAGGGVVFASEIKCLAAYRPFDLKFDANQLASIYRVWTPVGDQTGFEGVSQVPAGSYLHVEAGAVTLTRYVSLGLSRPPSELAEAELLEMVRNTLSESVKLRLRSDVEVGVYLSGGLDSAIVAQLIADIRPGRLKSFSVEFDDREFDESTEQSAMVRHLGSDHAHLRITDRDIVGAFPDALWHAEVPVFRTAFVPMFLLSKLASSAGVKVVMSGEGADEAFLGYDIFKETLLRSSWGELDRSVRLARLAALYPYLTHFSEANSASLYAFFDRTAQIAGDDEFFSHQVRFHNSRSSGRLLGGKFNELSALSAMAEVESEGFKSLSVVEKAQWLEFKTLLSGYLLSTQGDRMSSAHGVENRCPFLDPEVLALGCSSNGRFFEGHEEKHLLRKAFSGMLPKEISQKRKRPYRAPDAAAFLREKPDYLDLVLAKSEIEKIDVFDARYCSAFAEKIMSREIHNIGQADNQTFIFLLSTSIIHDKFVRGKFSAPQEIDDILVRRIDGRIHAEVDA